MIFLKQRNPFIDEQRFSLWKALVRVRDYYEHIFFSVLFFCAAILIVFATVWTIAYIIAHWPVIA